MNHHHVHQINYDHNVHLQPEHEGELCGGEEWLPGTDGAKVILSSTSLSWPLWVSSERSKWSGSMIIDHGDGDDYHSIRFLKDNIELERQQAIRDIMVKRDIARWLQVRLGILLEIESRHLYHQYISLDYHHNNDQARLAEIEARHGVEAESREAVRRLTRRRSRWSSTSQSSLTIKIMTVMMLRWHWWRWRQ